MIKIKKREKIAIIDSLRAGVVPRIGLQHIHAGRHQEIMEIKKDFEQICEGVSKIRFIIGEFGSGKTFFLSLVNNIAHEYQFVTSRVDISTEKVLYSKNNRSQALYSEIMHNLSLKNKPEGTALKSIIERWINDKIGIDHKITEQDFYNKAGYLKNYVSACDFAALLYRYYKNYLDENDLYCNRVIRWLCAGYSSKTEVKAELGIHSIINDENYYDYLKMMTRFFIDSGYRGFLIGIDELAVLTRLPGQIRTKNYETVLKWLNDSLQGRHSGCYILFGGTPELLRHPVKGLYSYGALKTRLGENFFSESETHLCSGPVLELKNLKKEELFVIFVNIRNVFAEYDTKRFLIDDSGIEGFANWCYQRLGADLFLSPRDAVKNYVDLLILLENNPGKSWKDYIQNKSTEKQGSLFSQDENKSEDLVKLNNLKL